MNWIFVLLAFVIVAPFAREFGRNKISRQAPPEGEILQLSQGRTFIRWSGPLRGPVVVAVHGIATPSLVWQAVSEGLNRMGYRVLVYDLYGRGLSDAPRGLQDSAFFSKQLSDVLEHERLGEDVILMGYSMGGAIAADFASENPQIIKRLVLIAPSGLVQNNPTFRKIVRLPLIGDWLHALLAPSRFGKDAAAKAGLRSEVEGLATIRKAQAERRGFFPALLSSQRGILSKTQEAQHRKLGHDGVPVVALWGDKDKAVPISALGVMAQWNRLARQEVIEGADHELIHTHASEVVTTLRDILREV